MQISILSASTRRQYKQYLVDGVNTIGVMDGEEYIIRFKNTSYQKIQARIAVDGTDVQTGQKANLNTWTKMWVVDPLGTMELVAWPETDQGGARFKFTVTEDSVAVHTHGDLTAKGYISVAVFTEAYVEPPQTDMPQAKGMTMRGGHGPATGAGDYAEQRVVRVQGLKQPEYSQIVQVRYIWADELERRLQQTGYNAGHPTGFEPTARPMANLGSTPRPGQRPPLRSEQPAHTFSRFE